MEGATAIPIRTYQQIKDLIDIGNNNRSVKIRHSAEVEQSWE